MIDGSGALLAEHASVEVDRLGATATNSLQAHRAMLKSARELHVDLNSRLISEATRNFSEISDHLFALMRAKTPIEACKLHSDYVWKRANLMKDRFYGKRA